MLEQPIADNAAVIDIVAITAAGVQLAIEVDGPTHFVQPRQYTQWANPAQEQGASSAGLHTRQHPILGVDGAEVT